jgi:hypothetical protein
MDEGGSSRVVRLSEPLRVLTPHQISQIDRCLAEIEEFGRITLVKNKGRLRFIEKTESVDALRSER